MTYLSTSVPVPFVIDPDEKENIFTQVDLKLNLSFAMEWVSLWSLIPEARIMIITHHQNMRAVVATGMSYSIFHSAHESNVPVEVNKTNPTTYREFLYPNDSIAQLWDLNDMALRHSILRVEPHAIVYLGVKPPQPAILMQNAWGISHLLQTKLPPSRRPLSELYT